jgi:hypothetical protein
MPKGNSKKMKVTVYISRQNQDSIKPYSQLTDGVRREWKASKWKARTGLWLVN